MSSTEVRAYLILEVEAGCVKDVLAALKKIKACVKAAVVTGPFDIIATIHASSLKELGDIVTEKVHGIEGIVHATTCVVTNCNCEEGK